MIEDARVFEIPTVGEKPETLALLESAAFTEEVLGVKMDMPETITCTHFRRNKQCLKTRCPFFPKRHSQE